MIFVFTCLGNSNRDSLSVLWNDSATPDSTRFKAINTFCISNIYSNPDTILLISDFHYDLAQAKDDTTEMSFALEHKALAFSLLGKHEKALSYSEEAVDLAIALKDSTILAKRYYKRGNIFYHQSKFREAIQYHLKSKAILEKQGTDLELADLLNNIGLVYFSISSYDFALEYLRKALDLYKKIGIDEEIGEIWVNIGVAYYEQEAFEKSVPNIRKGLGILQSQDHIVGVEYCYYFLAKYHQQVDQLDSAFFYINKSIEINEDIDNPSNMLRSKTLLANFTFEEDVAQATKIGEEALAISKNVLNQSAKRDVYKLLYECYKKQGELDLALAMNEDYLLYYDSTLVQENQLTIVREEIQKDSEQKLLETKTKNEQAKAALTLKHRKRTFAILLGSLLLIGIIGFVARKRILSQRQLQAELLKEIEQLKKESSNTAAANLHASKFQLDRAKIEKNILRKLNETDWIVLNILLEDPVISNKGIAAKAFMTTSGIGSSLRRMYSAFNIKESKYMKISLLMEVIKISNN